MEKTRTIHKVLTGKPHGKRSTGTFLYLAVPFLFYLLMVRKSPVLLMFLEFLSALSSFLDAFKYLA
jgi:hypothetical protein